MSAFQILLIITTIFLINHFCLILFTFFHSDELFLYKFNESFERTDFLIEYLTLYRQEMKYFKKAAFILKK